MNKKTGVIIARFQTPYLHKGHIDLIKFVKDQHIKQLLFLVLLLLREAKEILMTFTLEKR